MAATRPDLLAVLHPVARALRRIEDEAAARHDLSMWQYAILSVAADTPGLNQGEVARALQYSANRIIADLDTLEERGLIARRAGADRRANVLELTAPGTAVRQRIQREIHEREDELLTGLSTTQQRQFRSVVGTLAKQLRSPDA